MKRTGRISRKTIYQWLVYGAILVFGYGLVRYSRQTAESAVEGLALCGRVIIPSLFPFFVLSSLAVATGLAGYIGKALEKPMQLLFRVPGACAPAFALGLVGGYPVGAKTAIALYEQRLCTKTQAERLLSFCNNSGPAFILGIAGASVFASPRAGLLLYACHVGASLLVGMIFRFYGGRSSALPLENAAPRPLRRQAFGPALAESVRNAGASTINICTFVVFFTVAIRLLNIMGILPAAASLLGGLLSPLGLDPAYAGRILSGVLELTTGIWSLSGALGPLNAKLAIAAFMLGWAGFSVHCQVLCFLTDSGLSAAPYIGGKLLHGILSAALTLLVSGLVPFSITTGAMLPAQLGRISTLGFGQALYYSVIACLGIWLLLTLLAKALLGGKQKKHCKARQKTLY